MNFKVPERGPPGFRPFVNPLVAEIWPRLWSGGVIEPDNVRIEEFKKSEPRDS
jgi:hypothetical protein